MKPKTPDETFKPVPVKPVGVPRGIKVTKSQAQKFLRRAFQGARFQTVTTEEDKLKGHTRLQVWAVGSYGKKVGLIEIAGDAEHLPKAAVVALFRRSKIDVVFSRPLVTPKALALMTKEQRRQLRTAVKIDLKPYKAPKEKKPAKAD